MDIMQKHEFRTTGTAAESGAEQLSFGRRLWRAWVKIGHRIGVFNSRVILTLLYFSFVTLQSWLMTLLGADPLRIKSRQTWLKRSTGDRTLTDARKQF